MICSKSYTSELRKVMKKPKYFLTSKSMERGKKN